MSSHTTNLAAFVEAASSASHLITRAYFGLVAIELVLKESVALKDHNVPSALNKFASRYAVGPLSGCKIRLNALATKLQNDLTRIVAQGMDGNPRRIPAASYPYLRYVRLDSDGWGKPASTLAEMEALASTVAEIRAYLRQKFDKKL
jgi:hypothetical protein